jgi:hypothetical protein
MTRQDFSHRKTGGGSRARLVSTLDWFVLLLPLLALVVELTGGFYVKLWGIRISAQRTDRVMFIALGLLALRLRIGRGIEPMNGRAPWLRRLAARLFNLAADVVPPSGVAGVMRTLPLAIVGFMVVGAVLLRTQLAHMDSVPDLGDPLFSMWRMGWLFQQLSGDPRPLFNANIFYPEPLTLTYSDSMLVPSLTGAPLLAVGLHPVIAYNVLFLSGFLFSAVTTYLLAVRITGSARAAFVAGLLYGFYPYRFEHYSHLELQMTYWMPLALLALHRFSQTLGVRYAVAAALCGVAQLYSSMYYGVFFPLYALAILAVVLLAARPSWRRLFVPAGVAVAIAGALAVPLARPYVAAQSVKGERDRNTVLFYSATLSDYFRPHPRSAVYGGRLLADEHPERALFPGATPLVLSIAGLVPPLGSIRLAYLTGLVFAFDLSLGLNGETFPYLFNSFEWIRGMRVPARISVILAISLATLGAFGVKRLLASFRTERARTVAFLALVTVVAIDLHPTLTLQRVWREPPPIYSVIASDAHAVLTEIPFRTKVPDIPDHIPYMYFSLWHWRSLTNGYSGFNSAGFREFERVQADFPGPAALAALKARGVTHVSVNCAFFVEGCERLLETLDGRPDFRQLASGRWQGKVVRLYKLD